MGERGARPFKRARSRNERDFFSLFSFLLLFLFFSPPPPPFCYRNRRAWHEFALSVSSSSRSSLPVSSFGDWPGGRGKANRFFFFWWGGLLFLVDRRGDRERESSERTRERLFTHKRDKFPKTKKNGEIRNAELPFLSLSRARLFAKRRTSWRSLRSVQWLSWPWCVLRAFARKWRLREKKNERESKLSLSSSTARRSLPPRKREREGGTASRQAFFP